MIAATVSTIFQIRETSEMIQRITTKSKTGWRSIRSGRFLVPGDVFLPSVISNTAVRQTRYGSASSKKNVQSILGLL